MPTKIVFTGDISFSKYFSNGYENVQLFAPEIEALLQSADDVVANLESPITTATEFSNGRTLNHFSSPEAASFLYHKNIRIWSIANNHMMDCGEKGLADTLRFAEENNCRTIGAGLKKEQIYSSLTLGTDIKVGMVSVAKPWDYVKVNKNGCGVFTWDETERLKEQIDSLREKMDWIVLVVHGGDEFSDIAMPYMRERYHQLLSMGADIIVAHHPHVVQEYERIGNKYIFYSLGNFVFDTDHQRKFQHTDTGVLLEFDFQKESFIFKHHAIRINRESQTIETAETPSVFCEIDQDEYNKLWSFAAKAFYDVDLRKRKMTVNSMKNAPAWKIILHEVYSCRHKREREIQFGRFLSYLGKWKSADCKDVIRYIKGEQK